MGDLGKAGEATLTSAKGRERFRMPSLQSADKRIISEPLLQTRALISRAQIKLEQINEQAELFADRSWLME